VQRRLLGLALALALLAGACGGGSKHASANKATTTTAANGATSSTAAAASNATGSGKGAVATPQMSTSKSAAKPVGSGGSGSGTGSGGSTSNPDTGLHAAAPGTYTYARTGTSHDSLRGDRSLTGNTSLKVDPVANSEQHSAQSSPDGSSSDQTVRFLTEGAYFTDLKQSTGGFAKEFQPNPPVLALPAQASIGRTWSWTVTSTDGKTTLNASFKVERNETLTIGGQSTPTVVLTVTLKASGDVTLDSTATDWVSLAKGLIVRTDSTSSGSIGTITFNSQSSSVLQSTKPS
jgi:hypothetical protein